MVNPSTSSPKKDGGPSTIGFEPSHIVLPFSNPGRRPTLSPIVRPAGGPRAAAVASASLKPLESSNNPVVESPVSTMAPSPILRYRASPTMRLPAAPATNNIQSPILPPGPSAERILSPFPIALPSPQAARAVFQGAFGNPVQTTPNVQAAFRGAIDSQVPTKLDYSSLVLPSPFSDTFCRSRPTGIIKKSEPLGSQTTRLQITTTKKIDSLSQLILRLGSHASKALQGGVQQLLTISTPLSLSLDQKQISEIERNLVTASQSIDTEVQSCIDACVFESLAHLNTDVLSVFFVKTFDSCEMAVSRKIQTCVRNFLKTGKTAKDVISDSNSTKTIKCRLRNGGLQILAKETIAKGSTKIIEMVGILLGSPIASFTKVFAYAKPRKTSGQEQANVAALEREIQFSSSLASADGEPPCVVVEPVMREKLNLSKSPLKAGAMELFDCDLQTLVCSTKYPLTLKDVEIRLSIALQLAQLLSKLHAKQCIHADFKPHNVLLKGVDLLSKTVQPNLRARITDLGFALPINQRTHLIVGTPEFIAPEQWDSGVNQTGWITTPGADMWSFGIVLFEMMYGPNETPFLTGLPDNFMELPLETKLSMIRSARDALLAKLSSDSPLDQLIAALFSDECLARTSAQQVAMKLTHLKANLYWWKEKR